MAISKDTESHIRPIADESLTIFSQVAEAAKTRLTSALSVSGAGAFANINTLTSTEAVRNREQITEANIDGYNRLTREPANASVVVTDEDGHRTIYYFSRATPLPLKREGTNFASYLSPVGRLAALRIGTEHTLKRDGRAICVEVVESARFHPRQTGQEWDSHNSVLESSTYGPLTITSLRELLGRLEEQIDATALESLLAEESEAVSVREGVWRGVIIDNRII